MQPLIVPDQILAPSGYSFCSVGNHVLDKIQQLLSANVKRCRKPRRRAWNLLVTLIYHISTLALPEHTNHCGEQCTLVTRKHLQALAHLRGSKSIQPLSDQGFSPSCTSSTMPLIPLLMMKSSLLSRELNKT